VMHLNTVIWKMSLMTSSNSEGVRIFGTSTRHIILTCIIDYSATGVRLHKCIHIFTSDCWHTDVDVCQAILALKDDGWIFNTANSDTFLHHGPDELKQKVLQFFNLRVCLSAAVMDSFALLSYTALSSMLHPQIQLVKEWRCLIAFTSSPSIKTTRRWMFEWLLTPCSIMITSMIQMTWNN
jgi:hypothetical protein